MNDCKYKRVNIVKKFELQLDYANWEYSILKCRLPISRALRFDSDTGESGTRPPMPKHFFINFNIQMEINLRMKQPDVVSA